MAKAIHWPKGFEETVRAEGTDEVYCALRPGTLYFDNRYWVADEVVDIRVNHDIIRKGIVVGDLKRASLQDLSPDDLMRHKPGLQTKEAILSHLNERYEADLTPESLLTLVYYKNLPLLPDESTTV